MIQPCKRSTCTMGPRPSLRLDVLEQLPTPHVDADMRTSFAYDACEASGYCLPQTEGAQERRPRVRTQCLQCTPGRLHALLDALPR